MKLTLGNVAPVGGSGPTTTDFQFTDDVEPEIVSHQFRGVDSGSTDLGRLGWLSSEQKPYFLRLREVEEIWKHHSTAAPSFVTGDDPVFVGLVSLVFGCPVQE